MMRADAAAPAPRLGYQWPVFWVLLLAGVAGALGALPYLLRLFGERIAGGLPISLPVLMLVQGLQITLFLFLFIGVGLWLAPKVGIRTPFLEAWLYGDSEAPAARTLGLPTLAGLALGVLTAVAIYGYMGPRTPGWPLEQDVPAWMRLLAAVYGGVDEEILMRLFLLSLVLWLISKLRRGAATGSASFWVGNAIVALLFGAAYLPAAGYLVSLNPLVVVTIVSTKAISGLVFGYLCWSRGLESAMLAHFVADLTAHFLGPVLAA